MSIITAKFRGECSVCGESIAVGEKIEYQKGKPTRHADCTPAEVPADAIHLGGGSGYGCDGWERGQVVLNSKRFAGSTFDLRRGEVEARRKERLAAWLAANPKPSNTLWDGSPSALLQGGGLAPEEQFTGEMYDRLAIPTPEYVAYRERRDAQVNAWKLATDFDRRAKEWDTARRAHEDAERAAGKAIGVELEEQFARDDGPEFLFVVSATRRYVREDGLSFGVGDDAGYLYSAVCRPATEAEAAPLVARREAARRRKQAAAELAAIAARIRDTGERPEGPAIAEGDRLVWDGAESVIYGGGRWFTLGAEWIWSIANNGADGDDWSVNNVRTGGAGAVGWRVAAAAELAAEIRSLFKIVGGDS